MTDCSRVESFGSFHILEGSKGPWEAAEKGAFASQMQSPACNSPIFAREDLA